MARLTGWLLLWAPLPLLAEETAKAGENAASGGRAPDTVATILSLGAGLLAVVAIIYGCAIICCCGIIILGYYIISV